MYDIRLHRYKANFQFRNTFSDEERSSDIEKLSDLLDNCDFFFAAFIFFLLLRTLIGLFFHSLVYLFIYFWEKIKNIGRDPILGPLLPYNCP